MGGVSWGNGEMESKMYKDGKHRVLWFINNGITWYDVKKGIALDGWEKELEPYEGEGWKGWPFDECPEWLK